MNLFWVDNSRKIEISYSELYKDIVAEGEGNIYIQNENPYFVFVNLLRNLLFEIKSIILDDDFSKEELVSLGVTDEVILSGKYFQSNLSSNFKSLEEILRFYELKKCELEIEIFTSGTSGKPKKVNQNLGNVIRAVKTNDFYASNIWGFAYSPTHFAGLQVFFQAFFNKNMLIYIFNSDYAKISELLREYDVSHLSCTPTFMKLLIPNIDHPIIKMQSLTFGGERFDMKIEMKINEKFPNAIIKNVYASTEAGSLLRADGDFFEIPEKYKLFIKVDQNELLINKKLLGNSDTFRLEDEWYRTGDLVEFSNENIFKFISRKSEIINVGGYKVNPSEVEEVIKNVDGVKDVHVFGRDNSIMGSIVVASIIMENNLHKKELKQEIKKICASKLQEFKIPRLINFVESFELTRTGKIKKL